MTVVARPDDRTATGDVADVAEVLATGWPAVVEVPSLPEADAATRIRAVAAGDFPVLAIPTQFGGLGQGLLRAAAAQRQLALVDPSVAIALNMHTLTLGLMAEYWRRHRDVSWFLLEGLADSHALVASAFAEPGGSANFLRARAEAVPCPRGYRVSGTKFPCSLSTTAEIFCLSAAVASSDDTVVALCPARSEGLTVEGGWDSLGMQASDTGRVVLRDVEVDDRLVFHRAPPDDLDEIVVAGIVWFAVLVAGTYHGVLSRLVQLAVDAALAGGATDGGQRQALLGRGGRELAVVGGAAQRLALLWEHDEIAGRVALGEAMALRAALGEARDRIVAAVTPVVGSRLYTASHPAARAAVDTLAVHHHPPHPLGCDQALGALLLGREMRLDPIL